MSVLLIKMELHSSTSDILPVENGNPTPKNPTQKNVLSKLSQSVHDSITNFQNTHQKTINWLKIFLINSGFIIYCCFAVKHFSDKGKDYIPICDEDEFGLLILLFCFIYFLVFYSYGFKPHILPKLTRVCKPGTQHIQTFLSKPVVKWCLYCGILVAFLAFLIVDSLNSPNRLIALVGFVAMLLFGFVFSKHPGQINWHPVILGLILQFTLGLFTIRWEYGRNVFKCTGDKVSTFLNYTSVGSSFVYGNSLILNQHVFAFEALSVIFFLSFMVKILYYYGIIQQVVLSIGWGLQQIMGTTICESVNSAANIFLGMTEAPILLAPYLQNLTASEMHAVMAAGFASVSGTVLAAYINFGAKASHLITASVMSAPAALCFSKLYYPETEISMSTIENIQIPDSDDTSVLDAASKGASQAVPIVFGIIGNVIAFVTFIAFCNGIINWFGILVGYDNWSLEELMSYVFMPMSFVMGVPWEECKYVGRLIGIKTIINEFIAYSELGILVKQGLLSKRTEAIATYAICGFSNPGSVGIMVSTMGTLLPNKRELITKLAFRAFVSGAIVCFMTASIAGILMSDDDLLH